MKKILVVTGSRAEYGLLYWLMKEINQDNDLLLQLIVTGMHLSPEFGLTYKEIEKDGFHIDKKLEILLTSDTPSAVSKSIGTGIIGFGEIFEDLKPDIMLVVGDRFEIFAAACAALIHRIPIAHCHGGESTEGVIDEAIRHSVTKMSHLHFCSNEIYRKRIIQLGENPNSVFITGAVGIENINRLILYSMQELKNRLDISFNKNNLIIVFHPVTLEDNTAKIQYNSLLKAIDEVKDVNLFFIKPNADTHGRIIMSMLNRYVKEHSNNSFSFSSLSSKEYLSLLKSCNAIIGNSSSGIIEAPSLHTATINIGDRQKGRLKSDSVIDCNPTYISIKKALQKVKSIHFQKKVQKAINPYGTENSSKRIIEIIKKANLKTILKKSFYSIPVNI